MNIKQLKKVWAEIVNHEMIEDLGSKYNEIANNVECGCYNIYFNQCRDFLRDLYNENEEKAEKYTDQQVWDRYKHVISLAGDIHTIKRHSEAFKDFCYNNTTITQYDQLMLLLEPGELKNWCLDISQDGSDLYCRTIIKSVNEPGFWLCYEIAADQECEFFTISEV